MSCELNLLLIYIPLHLWVQKNVIETGWINKYSNGYTEYGFRILHGVSQSRLICFTAEKI